LRENLITYLEFLLEKDLPFLLFRDANNNVVRILSQRSQRLFKKAPDNMSYSVFAKFQDTQNQAFILGEDDKHFTYNNPLVTIDEKQKLEEVIDLADQERYVNLITKAVQFLNASSVKKVVLSRRQCFDKKRSDLEMLITLLDEYNSAYCYFFNHPKIGRWMGATPEVLVNIKKNLLQTMSLAGTALYNTNGNHKWGKKELQEQELVTDFIIEQLNHTGATEIKKGSLETIIAGKLIHLRTLITAVVSTNDYNRVVEALHPTPAVCGLPRAGAMKFIQDNESYDRSFYSGYIGIIDKDQASYYVNLRCMELYDDQVCLYAGGGITKLSDPLAEFQETVNKLGTMKKLI
jgi:isochorismate synthase